MFRIVKSIRNRRGTKMHWVFSASRWTPREAKAILASLPVTVEVLREARYSQYFRFRVTPEEAHRLPMEVVCTAIFELVPGDEAADLLAGRDGRLPFKRAK